MKQRIQSRKRVLALRGECGNGLLESILFLPLALMVLFSFTDTGLTLLEQARMREAVRQSMGEQGVLHEVDGVLEIDPQDGVSVNSAHAYDMAQQLAQELGAHVAEVKADGVGFFETEFRASASIVVFDVDATTGALTALANVYTVVSNEGNPNFNIQSDAPEYNYLSAEEYLNELLEAESSQFPSRFAMPVTHTYALDGNAGEGPQYLGKAALAYVEVTTLSKGINPVLTQSFFGSYFAIQEQHVMPLKKVMS